MKVSETPEHLDSAYTWMAWFVFVLGGILIGGTIWLTLSNLGREAILNVLLPGATTGLLLMILGYLGARMTAETDDSSEQANSRALQIVIWSGLGLAVGIALGSYFGSIVLGIAYGPLVGAAVVMTRWFRERRIT